MRLLIFLVLNLKWSFGLLETESEDLYTKYEFKSVTNNDQRLIHSILHQRLHNAAEMLFKWEILEFEAIQLTKKNIKISMRCYDAH